MVATAPSPVAHHRPDPLARLTARRRRRCAVGVLLLALVSGCTGEPGDEPSGTATSPTVEPTTEPSEPSATPTPETTTVRVYAMVDTRNGLRLVRENRDVTGDDPLVAAVEQMIAGPDDPDYSNPWNPATTVLGVTQADDVLTVDLSEDARTANIGSEGAALMIQQLVWTVTDAAGTDGAAVLLTIAGEPAGELWGVVTWDAPVTRADPLSVRSLVQIDEPREGAQTGTSVTVSGDAAVFEAVLPWSVLDSAGAEVASGTTMTAEGQTFSPFSFTVDLEPGTYTVVITEDDPSDGEGGTPTSDTRTITVSAS